MFVVIKNLKTVEETFDTEDEARKYIVEVSARYYNIDAMYYVASIVAINYPRREWK